METVCFICHVPFQEGQVRAELPCHHSVHTLCLARSIDTRYTDIAFSCQCGEVIIEEGEEYDADNEDDVILEVAGAGTLSERERIRNLYSTDKAFRESLKKLRKAKAEYSRSITAVTRLTKEKKDTIRQQLLILKAQIEGLTSLKKAEVLASQEHKDHRKAKARFNSLVTRIERNYGCTLSEIARYLSEKPGMKRFNAYTRWRYRSYYLFQRPWSYRIPI